MEALFPIETKPVIDIQIPERQGEQFTFELNDSGEIIPIEFYVDAEGEEGISLDDLWGMLDMWSDPWAAVDEVKKDDELVPEVPVTGTAAVIVGYQAAQGDIMLC